MKIKKVMTLLLSAVVGAVFLAGCSGAGTQGTENTAVSEESSAEENGSELRCRRYWRKTCERAFFWITPHIGSGSGLSGMGSHAVWVLEKLL